MRALFFLAGTDWTPLISGSTYGHKQQYNFSHVTDHTTPRPSDGVTRAAIRVLRLSARICSTRFKAGISRRTFFVEQATLSPLIPRTVGLPPLLKLSAGLSVLSQRSG